MSHTSLASAETVTKTIAALQANGITAEYVQTAAEAKDRVLSLIPAGAEVMTMTSITLLQSGLEDALNSDTYASVKTTLSKLDRETDHAKMQQLGAAPEWVVGSVHAVTEDGKVLVVSNTGSQLPAYAYGASHVIWVVSTKKITSSIDDGLKRTQEHVVPLETKRAQQAYGLPENWETFISKILIINREVNPERLRIIFVNEDLGF
ncbi:MAG TPA: LUD domain-containing protein [Vitreimonas sp.]|nr:LUD domain-containing protein [Vitreimonas sp.]